MRTYSNFGMRLATVIFAVASCYFSALAQQDPPKQISADQFARSRDLTADGGLASGSSVFVFKRPVYTLKRVNKAPRRPAPTRIDVSVKKDPGPRTGDKTVRKTANNAAEIWKQIGVTLWKLSETKADKTETSRSLITNGSTGKVYGAARLSADTEFKAGDPVRLSIEAPESGYLYVIDREIYENEDLGSPVQIFPTLQTRGGNNRVDKGMITDIPSQSDMIPYFTLQSKDPKWRGELLTLILSPVSLPEFVSRAKPSPIDAAVLAALEDKYLKDTSQYEQEGGEGKPYTKAEKDAVGSRQLTLDDPFPQTIYRVKSGPNDVILINLKLILKK